MLPPVQRLDTMLTSRVSLDQYIAAENQRNRVALADFVYQRFSERYLLPFKDNDNKHGFLMMAAACLMIEALESYWNGWKKSPNSGRAFRQFFDRIECFAPFRDHSQAFYSNVRCGIMHQGETTGGWRIRRDLSAMFEPETLTVDAERFLNALDGYLCDYSQTLQQSPWDAPIWKTFRKKMEYVCSNSET